MATAARIVSPFPKPRALYIAGAKSGKPKPATERRNETAARATRARQWVGLRAEGRGECVYGAGNGDMEGGDAPDAACKLKVSTTYILIDWKFRMMPAPMSAAPCTVVQWTTTEGETDRKTYNIRHDPMDMVLRRPAVDEQARGEEERPGHHRCCISTRK